MNWYYAENEQRAGPVNEEQFAEFVRTGRIQPETLVWREGMDNWTPLREAQNQAPSAAAPSVVSRATTDFSGEPAEAVCAECGKLFPMAETLRYGNVRICANCKPVFMQKLAEGAPIQTGEMKYAGFWIRFVAKFVDGLILRVVLTPLTLLAFYLARGATPTSLIVMQVVNGVGSLLVFMAYSVLMNGKYGATLGKMACKIKIVTAEGAPISYARAFGRFFAEILSGCPTLFIGYIMVAFDQQKRGLHDRICNTRVIYK
jgi:uncharacterized RDD family membrane protein YckC